VSSGKNEGIRLIRPVISETQVGQVVGKCAGNIGIAGSRKKNGFSGVVWLASNETAAYHILIGVPGKRL
jgi:hypothetical protein